MVKFFKEKAHQVEEGASLIPNDDPTLLWMNSGVAALKKYFDGRIVPKIQELSMFKNVLGQTISKM